MNLDRLADLVAERVVERLGIVDREPSLIDASEVARRFDVSRDFVYAHADELGAVRLGTGDKPRLRFDPAFVLKRLAARPHSATTPAPKTSRRTAQSGDLLPIRGES